MPASLALHECYKSLNTIYYYILTSFELSLLISMFPKSVDSTTIEVENTYREHIQRIYTENTYREHIQRTHTENTYREYIQRTCTG